MRNITHLRLPFKGKWYVRQGGDTKKLNYHRSHVVQRGAFDFSGYGSNNKSYKSKGLKNEDYYAFGADVLAPADGEVIEAVQGIRDNQPGQTNLFAVGGNYVLIEHRANEYSFIAHLKQGSTLVKTGEKVKAGQKLGLCGNSGNSSEPHIHYHLQNSDVHSKFEKTKIKPVAIGIKVYFSNVTVLRKNQLYNRKLVSPIKDDIVGSSIAR
ncbi:MAG TPA: M23 family metallopeptidase [Candidatus Saccharimonadales bacterium]|nr:M23 family metallopeptidase [Candidatus Saccharimonadales bacterium]